jgi:urease accessory protein
MRAKRLAATLRLAVLGLLAADPAFAHHVMANRMPSTFVEGLLSGLGHPVIGLDHLAAIIAIGCLAASLPGGAVCAIGFVLAMLAGAAAHVGELTVPGIEILVALTVIGLGALLAWPRAVAGVAIFTLFGLAGLIHGYALGETIVGAEPQSLGGYFVGLALIQSGIALAAMLVVDRVAAQTGSLSHARLVGAGIVGFGVALAVQQLMPGA